MVKLAVVGLGLRAKGVIDIIKEVEPELRVAAVVDPDREGAKERLSEEDRENAVFYKDIDEMVSKAKPDALLIGTRCNLHASIAVKAARYDIPLYLEKPVAVDMRQATSLEKAFEKSKCPVVVSFPLRTSPLCELVRQYIDDGAIGSCEHISARNYVNYGVVYWQQGYRNYEVTQGLFLQKATHDLDYISYVMGSPIVRVAAMHTLGRVFGGNKKAGLRCSKCPDVETCPESPQNRKRNCTSAFTEDHLCLFSKDCGNPEEGMNEDSSSALLEFESGVHGIYTQVFFVKRDASIRGAIISGYDGTVDFDWYRNDLKWVRHHKPFTSTIKAGEGMSHFGGDLELAYDFIDLVKGKKKKSRTPIETGLASVYACLAAKESAQKGKFVNVRQVGQVSGRSRK